MERWNYAGHHLSRRAFGRVAAALAGRLRASAAGTEARHGSRAVAWIARITDARASVAVKLESAARVQVCLRERFENGSTGVERCVNGGHPSTAHLIDVGGLRSFSTYLYSVWQFSEPEAASEPGIERPGKIPIVRTSAQSAPSEGAVRSVGVAAERSNPGLRFTEEPRVVVSNGRAGVRWTTNRFSNAWVNYTPISGNGEPDPYALRQQFEIPMYGVQQVAGGLTVDHRVCLKNLKRGRRYAVTGSSALGREQITSKVVRFDMQRESSAYRGGFASAGVWRISQPLAGICALPGGRLLLLGPGGSVSVCRMSAASLDPVSQWTMPGAVADAAVGPDGRLFLISAQPGDAGDPPSSRIDVYQPDGGAGAYTPIGSFPAISGFPVTITVGSDGVLAAFTGKVRSGGIPESWARAYLPSRETAIGYTTEPANEGWIGQVTQAVAGADGSMFLLSASVAIIPLIGGILADNPGQVWTGQDYGAGPWTTAAAIASDARGNLLVVDDCVQILQQVRISQEGVFTPVRSGPIPTLKGDVAGLELLPRNVVLLLTRDGTSGSVIHRLRGSKDGRA